jgi:hypothetical protein
LTAYRIDQHTKQQTGESRTDETINICLVGI